MNFTSALMRWYRVNGRELPWRNTKDPYKIWLSEIILQQTRVAQGMPYYFKFIEAFPDVNSLAEAPEDQVLKLWQGLGYYSRARNMIRCAQTIVSSFNSEFPASYTDLISLPGIGPYTAAAIASSAFSLPHAVVDGNVIRVISRIHAIEQASDSTEGRKLIDELANEHLDRKDPGTYNQAIMDLGAGICSPKSPECNICPVSAYCLAREKGIANNLPFKAGKTKVRKRFFHYFDIDHKGQTYLKRRKEGDIWTGLYDFPLIETLQDVSVDLIESNADWQKMFKSSKVKLKSVSEPIRHVLSHQIIIARFYKIEIEHKIESEESLVAMEPRELDSYPVAKLMEKYLSGN